MLKHQVILIGAGIASLAAAIELIENGVTQVLILEAQNRVGGRIHSSELDDQPVELGAQWLYSKKSKLYQLCEVVEFLNTDEDNSEKIYYATQDGRNMNMKYVNTILEQIDEIISDIDENTSPFSHDSSLLSLIYTKYMKYFENKVQKGYHHENEVPYIDALFDSVLKEEKIDMGCESLAELSLLGWLKHDEADSERDELISLKAGGMKNLIEFFLLCIPPERILLNEEIVKIDYSSHENISVYSYNNETKQGTIFYSDYVICTIPLGCLKANHKTMFVPQLPIAKIEAIERLGFGTVDKLFIAFNGKLFQDENTNGVQVLWVKDMDFNLNALNKWKLERPKFYESFECFKLLPNSDNILYTFIDGDDAKYIERLVEDCLIDILEELFEVCFPNIIFPNIRSVKISRWRTQKYSLGSQTFIKIGSTVKDIYELSRPVQKRIFFAGEATSENYGSLDGAFDSGMRESTKILQLVNNNKK